MHDDSSRILRTAAWIWLGFLIAMAIVDFALYTPRIQNMLSIAERIQTLQQNQQSLLPREIPQGRNPFLPIYLFYIT
ncbi:MAG TPA: hypothetical protein PLX90_12220, partial [Anaerolineales bacterium]|nr:hypothetical protein [Anaerolineales bacterium]